ncbi:hypothetical protein SK803_01230 [Lentzea sp. BCCO 10_0856]|uniref:Uncharacterized protein n=1 Tax=Lentzea miocenica TaxID=3095431 RepID=A0ABU4SSD1_9PSEU|nr:hypothetical protein [Lentzea sp. BCCO 10_0856]MDX8028807.1 hypothetical protein [Lentzea sp. BCCO 10_0856]
MLLISIAVSAFASAGFTPVAFADDVQLVAQDFPATTRFADDVDWDGVKAAFGLDDASVVKTGPVFALARVAKLRGIPFRDFIGQLADGPNVEPMNPDWLKRVAPPKGYTVDTTPAVGAIAYFPKGTTLTRTGVRNAGPATYQGGHLAYVAGINADGGLRIEEYGYYTGEGYQTYSMPASSVHEFIHLAKSTKPSDWIAGDFEPSSPGVPRDIPNDVPFGNNYPVDDVAKDLKVPAEKVADSVLQCGTFAEWWVANQLGTNNGGLQQRIQDRGAIRGVSAAPGGSAAKLDEHYGDYGVRVDRTAAVGAIATWEAEKPGEPGHAAVVTRVYRLLKSDKEKADQLGEDAYPDTGALKKLIDAARAAKEPKLTYVLMEDYNGFGGPNKYGQKLRPAEDADHYVHLATSVDAATPLTPREEIAKRYKRNAEMRLRLGNPTDRFEVDGTKTTQHFETGSVTYDSATGKGEYSAPKLSAAQQQSLKDNPAAAPPARTNEQRLAAQIKQLQDTVRDITAKYEGRKPSGPLSAALLGIADKIIQLQAKLATTTQEK